MTSKPAPPQVQTNPAQLSQQPYLNTGYSEAQNLYQNNPMSYYPGQTLAPYVAPNPLQAQGYQDIYNTGASLDQWMRPTTNAAYGSAVSGGMSGANSPANPYYTQYAQGTAGPQQQSQQLYGQALAGGQQYANQIGGYAPQAAGYGAQGAANNNLGMSQLGQSASGAYLGANPWFDATVQSAIDPLARNYQTATAPTTDAQYSMGGRYGSGSYGNAVSTNEQNLAKQIGDTSNQMYSANYNAERARQDAAANQYGQLYNQGLDLGIRGATGAASIANTAGNQYFQGLTTAGQQAANQAAQQQWGATGLQNAYTAGNQAQMDALRMYPQLAQSQFIAPNATVQAGQGLSAIDQQQWAYDQKAVEDQMKRYYGEQNAPYQTLDAYMKNIGSPTAGSTSQTMYQNPIGNILGAASGATGIASNLGLLGGSAAAAAPLAMTAGGIPMGLGLGYGVPAAAAAAPLMGATIICSELVRQQKMPNRWRRAGMRAWASYPEFIRRGYHVWAIPVVHHMRRRPDSLASRAIGKLFLWRAEDLAARAGLKGARKMLRGRLANLAIGLPCVVCGALGVRRDWTQVYRDAHP